MIGMKEQNRSVKQMKAGLCVSALRLSWRLPFFTSETFVCIRENGW